MSHCCNSVFCLSLVLIKEIRIVKNADDSTASNAPATAPDSATWTCSDCGSDCNRAVEQSCRFEILYQDMPYPTVGFLTRWFLTRTLNLALSVISHPQTAALQLTLSVISHTHTPTLHLPLFVLTHTKTCLRIGKHLGRVQGQTWHPMMQNCSVHIDACLHDLYMTCAALFRQMRYCTACLPGVLAHRFTPLHTACEHGAASDSWDIAPGTAWQTLSHTISSHMLHKHQSWVANQL
jgi:hypothetical protein